MEMSWWYLSLCSLLNSPKFWGIKSRWESRKCNFSDMLHFITWKHFNISLSISIKFSILWFPRKLVHTDLKAFHAAFSVSLKVLWKSRSCITSHIYGTIKIPSFILASLSLGNLFLKYVKACPSLSKALTRIFVNASLMCRRGRCILRIHLWFTRNVYSTWCESVLLMWFFTYIVMFLVTTVPFA